MAQIGDHIATHRGWRPDSLLEVWTGKELDALHEWYVSLDATDPAEPGSQPACTFTLDDVQAALLVTEILRGPQGPAGPMGMMGAKGEPG